MLFHKKAQPNTEELGENAALVIARLRRQMRRQIIVMAFCMVVVCTAVFAYISMAWFATNRQVAGDGNSIVSETPSATLGIRAQGSADTTLMSELTSTFGTSESDAVKLFPISTSNCTNWYYADGFTFVPNAGGTGTVPMANSYAAATTTETAVQAATGAYKATYANGYESRTLAAYYLSKTNIYTNAGTSLDVYLDPANPITVEYVSNTADGKNLLGALRVAVVAGTNTIIYAPAAETVTGNSTGTQTAGTFYAITGGSLAACPAVTRDLSNYQATAGEHGTYTAAAGKTKLGTANPTGLDVNVYVWLEGTDGEALIGVSDEDLKGIRVAVRYVGVEPAA